MSSTHNCGAGKLKAAEDGKDWTSVCLFRGPVRSKPAIEAIRLYAEHLHDVESMRCVMPNPEKPSTGTRDAVHGTRAAENLFQGSLGIGIAFV